MHGCKEVVLHNHLVCTGYGRTTHMEDTIVVLAVNVAVVIECVVLHKD